MHEDSRVWIYQSSRELSDNEVTEIKQQLNQFTSEWVSHNKALKAKADVLHNRFIQLIVDESQAGASGCSIDKSVHFLQDLGFRYATDFFDRLNFAYLKDDNVQVAHKDDFVQLYQDGQIHDHTLVFNNLVKTKSEMDSSWTVPLAQSWHKNFV